MFGADTDLHIVPQAVHVLRHGAHEGYIAVAVQLLVIPEVPATAPRQEFTFARGSAEFFPPWLEERSC